MSVIDLTGQKITDKLASFLKTPGDISGPRIVLKFSFFRSAVFISQTSAGDFFRELKTVNFYFLAFKIDKIGLWSLATAKKLPKAVHYTLWQALRKEKRRETLNTYEVRRAPPSLHAISTAKKLPKALHYTSCRRR